MRRTNWISLAVVPLSLCAALTVAEAQGRGQGQGNDKGKARSANVEKQAQPAQERRNERAQPAQARSKERAQRQARDEDKGRRGRAAGADSRGTPGREKTRAAGRGADAAAHAARGRSATAPHPSNRARERASDRARFTRTFTPREVRPGLRRYVTSSRPSEFMTASAIALANARDVGENALVMWRFNDGVRIQNRRGDVLVALNDDRARDLGAWNVSPLGDRVRSGAPSFCRSGEGHPVWGRQWCVDKGFGIGTSRDLRWGRTTDLRDVRFREEPTTQRLTRAALAALLGDDAVDRLALHAVTMGLVDPLVGTWRTEATGPRVLLVNAGDYPVAEIVDVNRDRRGDVMLVALRPW